MTSLLSSARFVAISDECGNVWQDPRVIAALVYEGELKHIVYATRKTPTAAAWEEQHDTAADLPGMQVWMRPIHETTTDVIVELVGQLGMAPTAAGRRINAHRTLWYRYKKQLQERGHCVLCGQLLPRS